MFSWKDQALVILALEAPPWNVLVQGQNPFLDASDVKMDSGSLRAERGPE
jgi:hypothetical protein